MSDVKLWFSAYIYDRLQECRQPFLLKVTASSTTATTTTTTSTTLPNKTSIYMLTTKQNILYVNGRNICAKIRKYRFSILHLKGVHVFICHLNRTCNNYSVSWCVFYIS